MKVVPFAANLASPLLLTSCLDATQVNLVITTDIHCDDLTNVSISVGSVENYLERAASASTTQCNDGRIGSIVVVPQAKKEVDLAVRIAAGVGREAEQCLAANNPTGCVEARRVLGFIRRTSLELPVELELECLDVPCGSTQTCRQGNCVEARLEDPRRCSDPLGCETSSVDPCAVNNGGCEQICERESPQVVSCACESGVLQSDGQSCALESRGTGGSPPLKPGSGGNGTGGTGTGAGDTGGSGPTDPCAADNGGCEQTCQSDGSNVISCGCEFGVLQADEQSCTPESGYSLLYAYDLPTDAGVITAGDLTFAIADNFTALGSASYERVAFLLQLDGTWVWTSMNEYGSGLEELMIPADYTAMTTLTAVNVLTNSSNLLPANDQSGVIEFYSNCYEMGVDGVFNDDDTVLPAPDCWGAMQVHSGGETLWAYNGWAEPGSIDDVGIGSSSTPTRRDWTHSNNAEEYSLRRLEVYIGVVTP